MTEQHRVNRTVYVDSEKELREAIDRYIYSGISVYTYFEDKKVPQAFEIDVQGYRIRYEIVHHPEQLRFNWEAI